MMPKKKKRRKCKLLSCLRGGDSSSDEFEGTEDTKSKSDGHVKDETEDDPEISVVNCPKENDVKSSKSCVNKYKTYDLPNEKKTKEKELSLGKERLQKYVRKSTSKKMKLPKEEKNESKSLYQSIREIVAKHIFIYGVHHSQSQETVEFSALEKSVHVKSVQTNVSGLSSNDEPEVQYSKNSSEKKALKYRQPRAKDFFKISHGRKEVKARMDSDNKIMNLERKVQDMERKLVDSSLSTNPGAKVTIEIGAVKILVENLPTDATTSAGRTAHNNTVIKPDLSVAYTAERDEPFREEMRQFYERESQRFAQCTKQEKMSSAENEFKLSNLANQIGYPNEKLAPPRQHIMPNVKELSSERSKPSGTNPAFLKSSVQTMVTVNATTHSSNMHTCKVTTVSTSLQTTVVQSVKGASVSTSAAVVPSKQQPSPSHVPVVPIVEKPPAVAIVPSFKQPSPVTVVPKVKKGYVKKSLTTVVPSVKQSFQTSQDTVVPSVQGPSMSPISTVEGCRKVAAPRPSVASVPKSFNVVVPIVKMSSVANSSATFVPGVTESSISKSSSGTVSSLKKSCPTPQVAVMQSIQERAVPKSPVAKPSGIVVPSVKEPSVSKSPCANAYSAKKPSPTPQVVVVPRVMEPMDLKSQAALSSVKERSVSRSKAVVVTDSRQPTPVVPVAGVQETIVVKQSAAIMPRVKEPFVSKCPSALVSSVKESPPAPPAAVVPSVKELSSKSTVAVAPYCDKELFVTNSSASVVPSKEKPSLTPAFAVAPSVNESCVPKSSGSIVTSVKQSSVAKSPSDVPIVKELFLPNSSVDVVPNIKQASFAVVQNVKKQEVPRSLVVIKPSGKDSIVTKVPSAILLGVKGSSVPKHSAIDVPSTKEQSVPDPPATVVTSVHVKQPSLMPPVAVVTSVKESAIPKSTDALVPNGKGTVVTKSSVAHMPSVKERSIPKLSATDVPSVKEQLVPNPPASAALSVKQSFKIPSVAVVPSVKEPASPKSSDAVIPNGKGSVVKTSPAATLLSVKEPSIQNISATEVPNGKEQVVSYPPANVVPSVKQPSPMSTVAVAPSVKESAGPKSTNADKASVTKFSAAHAPSVKGQSVPNPSATFVPNVKEPAISKPTVAVAPSVKGPAIPKSIVVLSGKGSVVTKSTPAHMSSVKEPSILKLSATFVSSVTEQSIPTVVQNVKQSSETPPVAVMPCVKDASPKPTYSVSPSGKGSLVTKCSTAHVPSVEASLSATIVPSVKTSFVPKSSVAIVPRPKYPPAKPSAAIVPSVKQQFPTRLAAVVPTVEEAAISKSPVSGVPCDKESVVIKSSAAVAPDVEETSIPKTPTAGVPKKISDKSTAEDTSKRLNSCNQQPIGNSQSCTRPEAGSASDTSGKTDTEGNSAAPVSDISVEYKSSDSSESFSGNSTRPDVSDAGKSDHKHNLNLSLQAQSIRIIPAIQNDLKSAKTTPTAISRREDYKKMLVMNRRLASSSESEDPPKLPRKITTRKVDNINDDFQINTTSDSETSSSECSSSHSENEQIKRRQYGNIKANSRKGNNTKPNSETLMSQKEIPSKVDEGILFGCKFSSRPQEALEFQASKSCLSAASLPLNPFGTSETCGKDNKREEENSLQNSATPTSDSSVTYESSQSSGSDLEKMAAPKVCEVKTSDPKSSPKLSLQAQSVRNMPAIQNGLNSVKVATSVSPRKAGSKQTLIVDRQLDSSSESDDTSKLPRKFTRKVDNINDDFQMNTTSEDETSSSTQSKKRQIQQRSMQDVLLNSDTNAATPVSDRSVEYESSQSSELGLGRLAAPKVCTVKTTNPKSTPKLSLHAESVRNMPSVKIATTASPRRTGYNQTLIVDRQLDSSSESANTPKMSREFTTKVDNIIDDFQMNTTSDDEKSSEHSSTQSKKVQMQQRSMHEKVKIDTRKRDKTKEKSTTLTHQPPLKVDDGILFGCKFSSRAQEALEFQTSKACLGVSSLVLNPIGKSETGGKDSLLGTDSSPKTNAKRKEERKNNLEINKRSDLEIVSKHDSQSGSTQTQIPKDQLHQKPLLEKRKGDNGQEKLVVTATGLQPPSVTNKRKIVKDDNIFGCKFSSRAQEALASMTSKPRLGGSSLVLQPIGKSEPPAKAVNTEAQAIFKAELEISHTKHPDVSFKKRSERFTKKKPKKKLQQLSGPSETAFQQCSRDEIRNMEKELLQRGNKPISNPLLTNGDLNRGPKGGVATASLPPPRGPPDLLAPSPFKKKSGKSLAPVRNKSGCLPMPKSQAIHHPQFMDPTSAFPERYLAEELPAHLGYPISAADPAVMDPFCEMDPYDLISQQYAAAMDAHQYEAAMNVQQYASAMDAHEYAAAMDAREYAAAMDAYQCRAAVDAQQYAAAMDAHQYAAAMDAQRYAAAMDAHSMYAALDPPLMNPYETVDPIGGIPYPYPDNYSDPEMMGQYTGLDPTFSSIQRQSGFNDHMMGPVDPLRGIPYPYPDDYPHPEMMGQYMAMDPTFSPVQRQSGFNDHMMMGHMMPQSNHDNKGRLTRRQKISSSSLKKCFPPR